MSSPMCVCVCVKVLSSLVAAIVRAGQGLKGLTWIDKVPHVQHRYTITHTSQASSKRRRDDRKDSHDPVARQKTMLGCDDSPS